MKFNYLLEFLTLLSISSGIQAANLRTSCDSEVPSLNISCMPPGPPVYYPDPEECSNFWMCVGGCASNEKCQEDYLFDTEHGYCNHPEVVDCGDRPCTDPDHCPAIPETTTTEQTTNCPSQVPSGETCLPPGPPMYYPDPDECSNYWLCVGGCASNGKCQEDYLYDNDNGYCNHPEAVDCGARPCQDQDHCPATTIATETTPTTTAATTPSTTVTTPTTTQTTTVTTPTTPVTTPTTPVTTPTTTVTTPTTTPTTTTVTTPTTTVTTPTTTPVTTPTTPVTTPTTTVTTPTTTPVTTPTTPVTTPTTTVTTPTTTAEPTTAETTPTTTEEPITNCPSQVPGGETCLPPGPPVYYPDPDECSNYWLCVGGCASNGKCQEDYLYDNEHGYCNHPEDVDCGDRPCQDTEHCPATTPISETTTETCISQIPSGQHCPGATVNLPDVEDCSKYWHCEGGCATNQQCELNFLFDMASKNCKEAAQTDCSVLHRPCMDPQHCPCVNYNAHDDYFCEEDDFEEFFPDMNDCARFMNCSGGCFSSILCPENYLYDTEKLWCSYPHEITCGERPCPHPDRCGTQLQTTTTTSTPTTPHPPTDPASSTDPAFSTSTTPATTTDDCGHTEFCQDHLSMGIYADPYNCRKYWRCTNNGAGDHYTCEGEMLFDLNYMGCNYPYLVDCQDRPICDDCDENCETTTPAQEECEVHQCTADGFFCETKCANTYCRCFGGHGFLGHCPAGQLWDCEEMTCNFKCLVDGGACCPYE